MGVSEQEKREQDAKRLSQQVMSENFPNLERETDNESQ